MQQRGYQRSSIDVDGTEYFRFFGSGSQDEPHFVGSGDPVETDPAPEGWPLLVHSERKDVDLGGPMFHDIHILMARTKCVQPERAGQHNVDEDRPEERPTLPEGGWINYAEWVFKTTGEVIIDRAALNREQGLPENARCLTDGVNTLTYIPAAEYGENVEP